MQDLLLILTKISSTRAVVEASKPTGKDYEDSY